MVDDDSDEMLGARLDSALRSGLALAEVDVESLVVGSRRRARRVRSRRIAGAVTTTALVVGVPVGYEVVHPGAAGTAPPAALLPSHPGVTDLIRPTARPNPVIAPSAVPPTEADTSLTYSSKGQAAPTAIPELFAFTAAELPPGLTLQRRSAADGGLLVDGQICSGPERPRPAVGRQWIWSTDPGQADDLSVSLTVTAWAAGQAATAFATVVEPTGNCTWKDPQTPRVLPEMAAERSWASTSDVKGEHYARAVVQVGDGIVGVQVRHPKTVAAATEIADRLAKVQVSRLQSGVLTGSG